MRSFQQTVQKRRWPIFLFLYLMHGISISVPDHKHVFFCGDKKCINYFDAGRDCIDNECIPCIRMLQADTKFTISKSRSRAEVFKFVKRWYYTRLGQKPDDHWWLFVQFVHPKPKQTLYISQIYLFKPSCATTLALSYQNQNVADSTTCICPKKTPIPVKYPLDWKLWFWSTAISSNHTLISPKYQEYRLLR